MSVFKATRKHYNAGGVHPTTDPDNPRSQFAVDRYEDHLRKLVRPGMRALDLGCNAGRFTFAMADMGAIATGIDFASVQLKRILSDKGMFVVIMHDELVKRAGEKALPERYDVQTGLIGGSKTIPDKGTYAYPTYFWTVPFAKHIIEKYFLLERVVQIEENRFMLVFRNKKRNGDQ